MKTDSECLDALLDLLCYEIECRRLRFETTELLEEHVLECESCRDRIADFREALRARSTCRVM